MELCSYVISDLALGDFLLFLMASIELNESVYITHLMSSLSFICFIDVFIDVILAV